MWLAAFFLLSAQANELYTLNNFYKSPQLATILKSGAGPEICPSCSQDPCVSCNDVCFKNKTGPLCESCWKVDPKTNFACLSDAQSPVNVTSCASIGCWILSPCDVCDFGSCKTCKGCQNSKEGACAACWKPDSAGYSCLSENKTYIDCKGCWNPNAPPIVIPPGLTASNISAVWKGVPGCDDQLDGKDLWPIEPDQVNSLKKLTCYLELMKIHFDSTAQDFIETKGVTSSTLDWGGLDGLSFGYLLRGLYAPFGWREGVNMFGIPFDWRFTSRGKVMEAYYARLKTLIEEVYGKSNNQKVHIVAPSYGPQVLLGFLHRMTQQWKDKYIGWFAASAPVWGGAPMSLVTLTSGIPLLGNNHNYLQSKAGIDIGTMFVRALSLNVPVSHWICPRAGTDQYSFPKSYPLIITPSKNYSAYDVPQLLEDMGHAPLAEMFNFLSKEEDMHDFGAPLVDTWVNYATGIETPERFVFAKDFVKSSLVVPDSPKVWINASDTGDGVVTLRSSLRGHLWAGAQKAQGKQLGHKNYPKLDHAMCMFPIGDSKCFFDLLALLKDGVIPPSTDDDNIMPTKL